MGIEVLYKMLLSKYEFSNNWLGESHTLLKDVNSYLNLVFILLENLREIEYIRFPSDTVRQLRDF
jgi:hypothetical protein